MHSADDISSGEEVQLKGESCSGAGSLSRKGAPWSVEEHCAFLKGLEKLGEWLTGGCGIVSCATPPSHPTTYSRRSQSCVQRPHIDVHNHVDAEVRLNQEDIFDIYIRCVLQEKVRMWMREESKGQPYGARHSVVRVMKPVVKDDGIGCVQATGAASRGTSCSHAHPLKWHRTLKSTSCASAAARASGEAGSRLSKKSPTCSPATAKQPQPHSKPSSHAAQLTAALPLPTSHAAQPLAHRDSLCQFAASQPG
ncbi:hypothetical protein HaLaN_27434, partial [Haematococcus lacustris]